MKKLLTPRDFFDEYGGAQGMADRFGLTKWAVYKWRDGFPLHVAIQIVEDSDGEVRLNQLRLKARNYAGRSKKA